MMKINYN